MQLNNYCQRYSYLWVRSDNRIVRIACWRHAPIIAACRKLSINFVNSICNWSGKLVSTGKGQQRIARQRDISKAEFIDIYKFQCLRPAYMDGTPLNRGSNSIITCCCVDGFMVLSFQVFEFNFSTKVWDSFRTSFRILLVNLKSH